MIRLRDIALPPEHNAHQLQFEAAQMLHISVSKIRQLRIVRRSVDARKKPDIKVIYTVDVTVDGNEKKILKFAGCKRASIAPVSYYKVPNSKIRGLKIVRRSVDARKKPDVKIIYTVDVAIDGNEEKIVRKSGCKRASVAPISYYKAPKCPVEPEKRPVVVGFGPAGMFAALILEWRRQLPWLPSSRRNTLSMANS